MAVPGNGGDYHLVTASAPASQFRPVAPLGRPGDFSQCGVLWWSIHIVKSLLKTARTPLNLLQEMRVPGPLPAMGWLDPIFHFRRAEGMIPVRPTAVSNKLG